MTRLLTILLAFTICSLATGCGFLPFGTYSTQKVVRGANAAETAQSQLGKRYRPGGASPQKGFDCSGLVWWSYQQHGIKVPRITSDQARTGKAVSKKYARPGDIMIFKTSNSPRGLHSGLYCGNGAFIHSPGKGKRVCLEKLAASYWKDRLIAIRRVAEN